MSSSEASHVLHKNVKDMCEAHGKNHQLFIYTI